MKTTEQITEINQWWLNYKGDGHEFKTLIEKRQRLSALSLQLAIECANYKVKYDNLYAQRKINIAKQKDRLIESGETASSAEAKAKVECQHLIEQEKTAEGAYFASKIILTACDNVLNAMQQDISIYKSQT